MIYISLFGATTVTTERENVKATGMGGAKPRQILAILAAAAGSPVPKDRLADLLWDGEPPRSYVGTLESYVCVLRRQLGSGRGRASAITTTSNGYLLDPALARVDLAEFRSLVGRAARSDTAEQVALTEEAVALVRGELLASEPYADWADAERTVFSRELVAACCEAAEGALTLGDYAAALRLARTAIRADMLTEYAWQLVMRALWGSGRRCEALRAYADLRVTMATELGVEPGPVSHGLYMQILADTPAAPGPRATPHTELRTLMGLLRQALEAIPDVEVPTNDYRLSEVAARLIQVA